MDHPDPHPCKFALAPLVPAAAFVELAALSTSVHLHICSTLVAQLSATYSCEVVAHTLLVALTFVAHF